MNVGSDFGHVYSFLQAGRTPYEQTLTLTKVPSLTRSCQGLLKVPLVSSSEGSRTNPFGHSRTSEKAIVGSGARWRSVEGSSRSLIIHNMVQKALPKDLQRNHERTSEE